MARKYLRGLTYITGTNGRDIPIFIRVCYEFWGYCVNGTSALTTPGGMPITPTAGPTNYFEGTTVLATGNDGVTSDLGINFTSPSANFNISMIGKHITIWSHTDPNSTDNSIYRIINVPSSTQLMLEPFSGGTPDITTLKNNLTSRSGLNYRVIDLVAASQLTFNTNGTHYFVGTLSGASGINPGQASSQFQLRIGGSFNTIGKFSLVGSPSGTWNGSAFTGATLTERVSASSTSFNGTSAGINGTITLIADTDFFIGHIRSPNSNASGSAFGLYFYILVPQRLYTQAQDTNPLAMMVGGNNLTASNTTDSISSSLAMVGFDNITRTCQLMTKNFVGDGTIGTNYTIGPNLASQASFHRDLGKIIYTEALMSTLAFNQYSLARAKVRPIAFTSATLPSFHLIGNNGEFIHVGNGVLWPWDGAIMPYNLLPLGT